MGLVAIGAPTLVLYTDGLIERRAEPITTCLDRLARAAAVGSDLPATRLCDQLLEFYDGDREFTDDVAIVMCRALEESARQFSHRPPSDLTALQELRYELGTRLANQEASPDLIPDVDLAVNEVATNSIEDRNCATACGVVTVTGVRTRDAIDVYVSDPGPWQAGALDPPSVAAPRLQGCP